MQEDCVRGETSKAAVKATRKEGDKEQERNSSVVQTPVQTETGTTTPAGAGVDEEMEEVVAPRATGSTTSVPSGSFLRLVLVF